MPKVAAMLSNRSNRNMVESAPDSLGPSDFKYLGIRHSFCDQPIMFKPNEGCQIIFFSLIMILFVFKFSNMWAFHIPFVPKSDCPRPVKDAGAGNYFRSFDFGFRLFSVFPHKGMLFCTLCGVAGM